MPNERVKIVTLGCAKNEVDSEEIAGVLVGAGYMVGRRKSRDVTVINTCGFLQAAKRSIAAIRQAVADKAKGKTGRVIVAGCLAQRLGKELAELAPGADAYIGVGQMARFGEILQTSGHRLQATVFDIAPPHHRWADVETRRESGGPGART